MENMDEDYDNDILNVGRNNELQEKNNTIEKLERQINSMKNTNEKIFSVYNESLYNSTINQIKDLKNKSKSIIVSN